MTIKLVAVVRRAIRATGETIVCFTSLGLLYPDGRDCGVPMFVEGYEGASELLRRFGVTSQKLEEHRRQFEKDSEVRIPLIAAEAVVREAGFNPREQRVRTQHRKSTPRELQSRKS